MGGPDNATITVSGKVLVLSSSANKRIRMICCKRGYQPPKVFNLIRRKPLHQTAFCSNDKRYNTCKNFDDALSKNSGLLWRNGFSKRIITWFRVPGAQEGGLLANSGAIDLHDVGKIMIASSSSWKRRLYTFYTELTSTVILSWCELEADLPCTPGEGKAVVENIWTTEHVPQGARQIPWNCHLESLL